MNSRSRHFTPDAVYGVALGAALAAVPPTLIVTGGAGAWFEVFRGPRLSWSSMLDLAVVVSWVAWVGCVLPITSRVVARVRVPVTSAFGYERGWDRAASPIAAALLLVGALFGPIGGVRGAFSGRTRIAAAQGATALLDAPDEARSAAADAPTSTFHLTHRSYRSATEFEPPMAVRGNATTSASSDLAIARATPVSLSSRQEAVDMPAMVSDVATIALCCMGVVAITRRLQMRSRRSRRVSGQPPRDALDVEAMQAATSDLDDALRRAEGRAPSLRLLRAGEGEFEFFSASEIDWAPSGVRLGMRGGSWILARQAAKCATQAAEPLRPRWLVVPVGVDGGSAWAILLEVGTSVAVLGPNAQKLIASFAARAYRRPASESIRVRSDEYGIAFSWVGSPSPEDRAYVTTQPGRRADLTIVVDESAVTIHPFGITVTPLPEADAPPGVTEQSRESHVRAAPGATVTEQPRCVEVRLLATVPRIDGLSNPLPTKRARRVVELLAYLAIHHPDPVSGDRLRTRVLGTPDADAAAKTLFNTVGAARHVLGRGPDGDPFLPSASRQGHYRLSELVGVDVVRAMRAFELARAADDPHVALALYRSGLDLVESEPLSGVLSGYSWWQSEGHEARLTAAVVEAACRAVRLAIASNHFEMTTWIIGRARLVDPYTERLGRAAMRAAAAAGDQARLRREWNECLRRVSELDPDAKPSVESYRLFDELVSRTNGSSAQASFAAIDDAP